MDSYADGRDFELLRQDPYTFAVLDQILRGDCRLLMTDHESLILCHSGEPYPVWIWTPDDCPEEDMERAFVLASGLCPFCEGYRFNLKYELAGYFIKRASDKGLEIGITTNLHAYDCLVPREPDERADGGLYCCTGQDAEKAAHLLPSFCEEVGEPVPSYEDALLKARGYIADNCFFFWKNAGGEIAACCSVNKNQRFAKLSSVYTLPGFRRKHYAVNLVYQVTKNMREMDYIPMLYTDADYPASNAAYEKVGYVRRGSLCTIERK